MQPRELRTDTHLTDYEDIQHAVKTGSQQWRYTQILALNIYRSKAYAKAPAYAQSFYNTHPG